MKFPIRAKSLAGRNLFYKLKRKAKIFVKALGFKLGYLAMMKASVSLHIIYYQLPPDNDDQNSPHKLAQEISKLYKTIKQFPIPQNNLFSKFEGITRIPTGQHEIKLSSQRLLNSIRMNMHFEPCPRADKRNSQRNIQMRMFHQLRKFGRIDKFVWYYIEKLAKIQLSCKKSETRGKQLMNKLQKMVNQGARLEINANFLEYLIERSDEVKSMQLAYNFCQAVVVRAFKVHRKPLIKFGINQVGKQQYRTQLKTGMKNIMKRIKTLLADIYKFSVIENYPQYPEEQKEEEQEGEEYEQEVEEQEEEQEDQ